MKSLTKFLYLFSVIFICLSLLTVKISFCQNKITKVVTLKQAIELALKNNPTLKEADLEIKISEEILRQSKFNLLPSINISAQPLFNFGRSLNPVTNQYVTGNYFAANSVLGTQVTIFSGFQKIRQIQENKFQLQADISAKEKAQDDLILLILNNYLKILTDQQLLITSRQQLTLAKENLLKLNTEVDVGRKTLVDILQAKSQVASAEFSMHSLQNETKSDIIDLQKVVLFETDSIITKTPDDLGVSLQSGWDIPTIKQIAISRSTSIRNAENKLVAAKSNISLVRSNLYPKIQLFTNLGTGYSSDRKLLNGYTENGIDTIGTLNRTNLAVVRPHLDPLYTPYSFTKQFRDNFYQTIGASIQVPVFSNFYTRLQIKKAQLTYENQALEFVIAQQNFDKLISQALIDVSTSREKVQSTTEIFNYNKKLFEVMTERYNLGIANSYEFNSAYSDFNKTQFDLVVAKSDLIFKRLIINFYLYGINMINYL